MKKLVVFILTITITLSLSAQVGIGTTTPSVSAIVDLTSTNKGFLPPRMNWSQIQAIPNPVAGLTVYDIGAKTLRVFDGFKWNVIGTKSALSLSDAPGTYSSLPITGDFSNPFECTAVRIANDKSVFIAGDMTTFTGTFGGISINNQSGAFFAKLDSNGTALFFKVLPNTTGVFVSAIDVDNADNLYLAAQFYGTIDADPAAPVQTLTSDGAQDVFIGKYNSNGVYQWAKSYGGPAADVPTCIVTDGINVYAGGGFTGTVNFGTSGATTITDAGNGDGWVAKYSAATGLNSGYALRMGGSTASDIVNAISIYSGGGIVAVGQFGGIASFGTANLTSAGGTDGFLTLVNNLGGQTTAFQIGGPTQDIIRSVQTDATGNIFIGGSFSGTANFAFTGTYYAAATGTSDGFIAKYSNTFVFQTVYPITGTGAETVSHISIDNSDNIYAFGTSNSPAVTNFPLTTTNIGNTDVFLCKIMTGGVFLQVAGSSGGDYSEAMDISGDGKLLYALSNIAYQSYLTFDKVMQNGYNYVARYEE